VALKYFLLLAKAKKKKELKKMFFQKEDGIEFLTEKKIIAANQI